MKIWSDPGLEMKQKFLVPSQTDDEAETRRTTVSLWLEISQAELHQRPVERERRLGLKQTWGAAPPEGRGTSKGDGDSGNAVWKVRLSEQTKNRFIPEQKMKRQKRLNGSTFIWRRAEKKLKEELLLIYFRTGTILAKK